MLDNLFLCFERQVHKAKLYRGACRAASWFERGIRLAMCGHVEQFGALESMLSHKAFASVVHAIRVSKAAILVEAAD